MTLDITMNQIALFILVMARISGLILVAPGYGSRALPMRIRAFLVIALSFLVTPFQSSIVLGVPENLAQLVWLIGNELGVGLFLGFGVNLVFASAQAAGQVIGQMSGMQVADVFNPTLGTSVPLFGQLLDSIMIVTFISVGGHQMLMVALLDTFKHMPVSQVHWHEGALDLLVALLGEAFALGLKIGAPVMVAMIISLLVMGLISRTLPQLNVIQVGFSLNSMIMLLILSLTLGTGITYFDEQLRVAIDEMRSQIVGVVPYGG